MPYVNIQLLKGVDKSQKADLVERVTAALVDVLGKKPEHIHIVLQEIDVDDWGYAGQLTSDWIQSDEGHPS